MAQSGALYRPSVLQLAQAGNLRAIAYWINSLFAPQGVHIHISPTRSGTLTVFVNFPYGARRDRDRQVQRQIVRSICYRLWTLNSATIRDVRIVGRVAGKSHIIWQQSVRIITPANRKGQQSSQLQRLTQRGAAWVKFQIWRSSFVSRLAVASFLLCYWMVYWELSDRGSSLAWSGLSQEVATPVAGAVADTAADKSQYRAGSPNADLERSREVSARSQVSPQFQGQVVRQVNPIGGEKVVALTFDDGPWTSTTEQILEILRQNQIKATFFWVGLQIQQNPEIARKVVADGHAIGNHTWRHVMQNVDQLTAAQEIGNTARLIYETTGVRTDLFRPPGGNLEGQLVPFAKQQNNAVTLWSVDSDDYYVPTPLIIDNVLGNVKPGSIVLMHDGGGDRTATVQALPQIITSLQRQGYRFVTVPELLAMQSQNTPMLSADPAPAAAVR